MANAQQTAFGSCKPSHVKAGRRHTETNRLCPERSHNLINLLSQTCAYAHKIAFTWCNTQRYYRRSASEQVQYGCPHMYDGNMAGPKQRAQGVVRPVD